MLSLFARLKRRFAPASKPVVRVFPDCFATEETVVPWDDVSRVLAHALPSGMRIEVRAAHLDEAIVLAETQPGFDAFVRMADLRLTFPLAWWEALPARATWCCSRPCRTKCRPPCSIPHHAPSTDDAYPCANVAARPCRPRHNNSQGHAR